eukprot:scaffold332_cov117-Cylindrotheca_fusiformis.AAC.15
MDLETYIARYTGETRLQRLLLIAQQTPDDAIATQAFGLAETQMKQDGNVERYKQVFGSSSPTSSSLQPPGSSGEPHSAAAAATTPSAGRRVPPTSAADAEAWILNTEASNRETRHVLQGRLASAQSHMHKDAIRTAYVSLAQHNMKTGHTREALTSLLRAMDYCVSRSQTAQLSILLLEAAFAAKSYPQVREYVTKMEHTLSNTPAAAAATNSSSSSSSGTAAVAAAASSSSSSSPTASSGSSSTATGADILQDVAIKLKMASGLERMIQGDYSTAATILTKLILSTPASKLEWPGVTCAEDIALYAALLTLATIPQKNRTEILELAEHPEALELAPAMKELLLQWARANYVKCMQAFSQEDAVDDENSSSSSSILPFPDLFLSGGDNNDKWEKLCQTIRERCLLEYLRPYQCIQLSKMSELFPSVSNMEDTLVDLMGRGLLLNAKLDARANVLHKEPIGSIDKKKKKNVVDLYPMEQRILDDAYAMLIRLACLEHDLCVTSSSSSDRHRRLGVAARTRRSNNNRGPRSHFPRMPNDIEDDDDDDDEEEGDDSSMEDTPMLDVDSFNNNARNPEDMY